jgi:hypothetical protein
VARNITLTPGVDNVTIKSPNTFDVTAGRVAAYVSSASSWIVRLFDLLSAAKLVQINCVLMRD